MPVLISNDFSNESKLNSNKLCKNDMSEVVDHASDHITDQSNCQLNTNESGFLSILSYFLPTSILMRHTHNPKIVI